MNLYFRELKANRKSLIIWSVVMILFVAMGMQKYDSMVGSGNSEEFVKLLDSMPKFLQAMWGLSVLDITIPINYYGAVYFYLVLMAAIHSGMLGANIISKEERDKTSEFLMVKPITRNRIITFKMLAAFTNVIIINLAIFIPSIIILNGLSNEPFMSEIVLLMGGMLLIQLLFMSVGIGMAAITKKPKKSVMITMSILLFTFFLSIIIDMNESIELLSFLTPFKYFDAKNILINNSINYGYLILTIGIVVSIITVAYNKYRKRDLYI